MKLTTLEWILNMKIKSMYLIVGLLAAVSTQVFAGHDDDQRVITAAANNITTIAQALKSSDDTAVTVTGTIVRQVKHDHYELKDKTGTIVVDIDDDIASPAQLKPGTKVRVIGEIDTHRHRAADIDAVKVEFL